MKYWLMKSEPSCFGIDDLAARKHQTEPWDGVRNYQARNMMRDEMSIGDKVLFYHSNCQEPGIVGTAMVASEAYPDNTAFDPLEKHFDPKSDPNKPRWYLVDVKFDRKFNDTLRLDEMRQMPELAEMMVLRKGNRLSITPVSEQEWQTILNAVR
ncbi:MAG: EVE domain-containing protein [Coxiellaceae bacterium]|nr:EVE domain-containing protein [Coxiellaceae bacterium]